MSEVSGVPVNQVRIDFEFLKDIDWTELAYRVAREVVDFLQEYVVPALSKLEGIGPVIVAILSPLLAAVEAWLVSQLPASKQ